VLSCALPERRVVWLVQIMAARAAPAPASSAHRGRRKVRKRRSISGSGLLQTSLDNQLDVVRR
jgi:hypothetical protein